MNLNLEELDVMRASLLNAFSLADRAVKLTQKELEHNSKQYYGSTALKMVNDAITALTEVSDVLLKIDEAYLREIEKSPNLRSMAKPKLTRNNVGPVQ